MGGKTVTLAEMIEYAVSGDVSWVFHRVMSDWDHKAFDGMLVASAHPLAHEPGTTERRFTQYVRQIRASRGRSLHPRGGGVHRCVHCGEGGIT